MTTHPPTVALIHATTAAIAPAAAAFADRFPEARLWNLLDDLLIVEADAAGGLTAPLRRRMRSLIAHTEDGGAAAILLTCSLYGPVTREVTLARPLPILASDQALFARVAREAPHRVAVLGPLYSAVHDTVRRLREFLKQPGVDPGDVPADVHVEGVVVDGARQAAADGDLGLLERLVTDQARRVAPSVDLVVLGQFSLTPALRAAQAAVSVPVLSPPHLAADMLREQLATAGVSV